MGGRKGGGGGRCYGSRHLRRGGGRVSSPCWVWGGSAILSVAVARSGGHLECGGGSAILSVANTPPSVRRVSHLGCCRSLTTARRPSWVWRWSTLAGKCGSASLIRDGSFPRRAGSDATTQRQTRDPLARGGGEPTRHSHDPLPSVLGGLGGGVGGVWGDTPPSLCPSPQGDKSKLPERRGSR